MGGDHQGVIGFRQVDGVDGAGLGFRVAALEGRLRVVVPAQVPAVGDGLGLGVLGGGVLGAAGHAAVALVAVVALRVHPRGPLHEIECSALAPTTWSQGEMYSKCNEEKGVVDTIVFWSQSKYKINS